MVLDMFLPICKLFSLIFIMSLYCFQSLAKEDLISNELGGKVVQRSAELSEERSASNLIDGKVNTSWNSGTDIFPIVIMFSMPKNKRFVGLGINNRTEDDPSTWAKNIKVGTANPFPHMGGWTELIEVELSNKGEIILFDVGVNRGRYFRIEISSALGSNPGSVGLGSFHVYDELP